MATYTSPQYNTSNQYIKWWLEVIEGSQSIVNNTTQVTVKLWIKRTNTGNKTEGHGTAYLTIDGTQYSKSITTAFSIVYTAKVMFEKTVTITHNADGTKTLNVIGDITHSRFTTSAQTFSPVLTTIPRATTPICAALTLDVEGNISVAGRASSSFTHTLKYKVGSSATTTIVTKTASTSVEFTPPVSLANYVVNSATGVLVLTCETYSGASLVGTKTINVSISVPANIKPSISALDIEMISSNVAISGWNVFVKGYSKAKLTATAAGAYGSTIKNYSFSVRKNGAAFQSSSQSENEYTSALIAQTGEDITFVVTVTDSRGRTAYLETDAYTVYDYAAPSVSNIDVFRCNSVGDKDSAEGTYISAKGGYGIAAVDGNNSYTTKKIEYKRRSEATWIIGKNNPDSDIAYVFGGGNISVNYTYDVRIIVKDDVGNSAVYETIVKPGAVLFHFKSGGKGVGVGGAATEDEFQVYFKSRFKENVEIDTGKTFKIGGDDVAKVPPTNTADKFPQWDGHDSARLKDGVSLSDLMLSMYPVGAIYISVSSISPATLFGGTWSAFGVGRTLVGYNSGDTDFNISEKTGGSKTVSLTVANMPKEFPTPKLASSSNSGSYSTQQFAIGRESGTIYENMNPFKVEGGGAAHNNLQPYVTVYMWKRTA